MFVTFGHGTQIKELKGKLGDEDAAASFSSVKEEDPAASDADPPATGAPQGSSESDSSAVLNDAEILPHKPAPAAAADAAASEETEAVVTGAALLHHAEVFFHGQLLKVDDDEAAFLGDDGAACGGFFADEHLPSLPWWAEPTEQWTT
jgi:homeobox-leucine zipper protein